DLLARFGERGPASGDAALLRDDQGVAKLRVHGHYQSPRSGIAHAHLPAGRSDRSSIPDALQQIRFAWTEGDAVPQREPQSRTKLLVAIAHRQDCLRFSNERRGNLAICRTGPAGVSSAGLEADRVSYPIR